MENKEIKEGNNKIEVITGNGDLDISPVSDYIEIEKPKHKDNQNIIIPNVKEDISTDNKEHTDKKEDNKKEENN